MSATSLTPSPFSCDLIGSTSGVKATLFDCVSSAALFWCVVLKYVLTTTCAYCGYGANTIQAHPPLTFAGPPVFSISGMWLWAATGPSASSDGALVGPRI